MADKIKYREYVFNNGVLEGINMLSKLPSDARKPHKNMNVWVTPEYWGVYAKLCRSDSKIDFGTGITG